MRRLASNGPRLVSSLPMPRSAPPGEPADTKGSGKGGDKPVLIWSSSRHHDPWGNRTPTHVPATPPVTMKDRLDYLVGPHRTCLLMGRQPPQSIENAHCLRRELKSMDPDLVRFTQAIET